MKKKENLALENFKKVEISKSHQIQVKGGLEIIVVNDTVDG